MKFSFRLTCDIKGCIGNDKLKLFTHNMTHSFEVHNIKISLKLETSYPLYFNEVIKKTKKIKYKNFGNFLIVYSDFTYTLDNTFNNITHCNITEIRKYGEIRLSKKNI